MKKFTTGVVTLTIALIFSCVLSCTEQDENPVTQNNLSTNSSGSVPGKGRSSADRVGGAIFNSAVGDPIDLKTAKQWISNYQDKNPSEIRSHFFGFEIIQQILDQPGSVGIRIHYAQDETGKKKLLIVGVNGEGNDLLPATRSMAARDSVSGGNTIADFSFPCPDYCPDDGL